MKAVPALVAVAVVAAPGAGAQDRLPAAARLVDARACGASPVTHGAVVTITPDGDGVRDCASLRIRLERPSRVELVVLQSKPRPGVVHVERRTVPAGLASLVWSPPPTTAARTYRTRIVVKTEGIRALFAGPVIRVRGPAARFERESYAPGDVARLLVEGGRTASLEIVDAATGVSVRNARAVDGPVVGVRVGAWRPGVYAARLVDGDTVTQAPLLVRAPARARPRVAVVLPTSTWQAYNFTDADGDGTGDTWYASRRRESARLDRPFMGDGMPPFFHRYDLPFLRWLRAAGHDADFLGDDDLDRVRDAATLFRGTGLTRGSRFGWSGVEISATTVDSPPGTCVVAEIPNLLGAGRTAQMTYYETGRGAKVFAAGAFCLANRSPVVATLLDNLWRRLARP